MTTRTDEKRTRNRKKKAPRTPKPGYTCRACGVSGLAPDEMNSADPSRCFDC